MKFALTSHLGDPLDRRTWSSAPANLTAALVALGVDVQPISSAIITRPRKVGLALRNVLSGLPPRELARFAPARAIRARHVAAEARRGQADHILCCTSLDAPVGSVIPYSVWVDDSWHLLSTGLLSPGLSKRAFAVADELDRAAFRGAHRVLTFSEHVRADIIDHYGVAAERVVAVGCGSGPLPPFTGNKSYADGHLLFVAKHQFTEKGGELVLKAFERICSARPQTRLVMVGNDDAIRFAEGRDGVVAHDFLPRETLNQLFFDAAMLVQPMLGDPWGQVYLEAMKAKAIVVSLNQAALPELTDNGRLGVLVDRPDAELLAAAVLATYERPQTDLERIAAEAQARVIEQFEWPQVAQRIVDAIGSNA
jgi:glycosyltransferase involved in cell wall biosynthesis